MNAPAAYLPRPTTRDKRTEPPRAYGRYAAAIRIRDAVVGIVRDTAANKGAKLIDLGCGDMPYRGLIQTYLSSYDGADLPGNAEASYHFAASGMIDAPDRSADLILSTQVLEHVRDVSAYLAEAHRLLAPGGQLILTTHGSWVFHPDPNDYWRWTPQGLKTALAEAGFEVVRFEGLLGLMPMGVQFFQDGLVRKLPKRLRNPACFIFQQLVLLADRFHSDADRAKDASIFAIVARKTDVNS